MSSDSTFFRSLCASVVATILVASCGARTDLADGNGGSDDGAGAGGVGGGPAPCLDPTCSDITRGTFVLRDAAGAELGWLFLFDGTGACGGDPVHYQIWLHRPDGYCARNSDLVVTESGADGLAATADNHGGSVGPRCGGEPFDESATLRLVRDDCEADAFTFSIENSEPGSPFTLDARAERCRCDIGWEACVDPLPEDPCAVVN